METLKQYALKFVGKPYVYNTDGPNTFDCGGFTQELLKSVGELPFKGDFNSQSQFDILHTTARADAWGLGSIAFFGKSVTEITHVAFCLDNHRMIEAAGGDSTTLTIDDALKRRAFVRIRLIKSRLDLVAMLKPRYNRIGYF